MSNHPINLIAGQVQNVRLPGCPEMFRKVTSVTEKDGWLRWYWESQGRTPEGRIDCGYAGIKVS